MAEFIKKFANPAAADQYAINDIPFITSVDGDQIQNLHCNLSGKKLANVSGTVTVVTRHSEMVVVIIEHENGTSETVSLSPYETYAEQDYSGYYSQDTYDSGVEIVDDYLVDNNYPYAGETIYDYCNAIAENPSMISFTVDGEPYEANEGDSWENWIDQETNGFSIGGDGNVINYDMNIVHDSSGNEVSLDDEIIDGESYSCWVD